MKLTIKKILIPLDGSKNSFKGLDEAIYIARQCNSVITGLYVIPFYVQIKGPRFLGPYRKEMLKHAREFMNNAKILSAKKGIVFKVKIIEGDVIYEDINNFAASRGFDIIIIASRGYGQIKGWFLGSVANELVHRSRIPILVVK